MFLAEIGHVRIFHLCVPIGLCKSILSNMPKPGPVLNTVDDQT